MPVCASVCVCVCVCAPAEHQLIIHWLHLPGLSTTSARDSCVQYCDYTVLLLHVLCVFAFALMSFSSLPSVKISSAILFCFCSSVHLSSSTPAPPNPPSLPARLYLQPPSSRPHHPPAPRVKSESSLHCFLSPLSAFGS